MKKTSRMKTTSISGVRLIDVRRLACLFASRSDGGADACGCMGTRFLLGLHPDTGLFGQVFGENLGDDIVEFEGDPVDAPFQQPHVLLF